MRNNPGFALGDAEEFARFLPEIVPPPIDIRMGLRAGDAVELLAVHEDPEWGPGMARIPAVVLGMTSPGRYIGGLEDGSEIHFSASHVADAAPGAFSPSMGGAFSEFFKKMFKPAEPGPRPRGSILDIFGPPAGEEVPPLPGLPGPPGGEMIPAPIRLPAPAGTPKKGLLTRLKETVRSITAPPPAEPGPGKKGSIFDIFKPFESPVRALAERPEGEISVPEIEPTGIVPIPTALPKFFTQLRDIATGIAAPEAIETALAPFTESAKELFVAIKPSPIETFESRQLQQKELFETMFGPPPPEDLPPITDIFKPFGKEEIRPREEVRVPPTVPSHIARHLKVLPLPPRAALLPSPQELARAFLTKYQPLEEIWEGLRQIRSSPDWEAQIEEREYAITELESLGTCGGRPNLFEELSTYFHIPWEELRSRAKIEFGTDPRTGEELEEWVNSERIWEEIIFPLREAVTQAFNLLKPPDLPGSFTLEMTHKHGCQLVLSYTEKPESFGAAPPVPGMAPPAPGEERMKLEEWQRMWGQSAPPQEEAHMMRIEDAVPPEAVDAVNDIHNNLNEGYIDPDNAAELLMEALEPHRAYIEARGNPLEYLVDMLTAEARVKIEEAGGRRAPKKKKKGRRS